MQKCFDSFSKHEMKNKMPLCVKIDIVLNKIGKKWDEIASSVLSWLERFLDNEFFFWMKKNGWIMMFYIVKYPYRECSYFATDVNDFCHAMDQSRRNDENSNLREYLCKMIH